MAKIIYEVNIRLESSIRNEFLVWLKTHNDELLQFEGFEGCEIYARELSYEDLQDENHSYLVVNYHIRFKEDLENYFTKYSDEKRAEAVEKFGDKYHVDRRVLFQI